MTSNNKIAGHEPTRRVPDASENARIQRLTQLYRALSEVNQAIIRMSEEKELFPLVCRTAVDYGGVSMAWIGIADSNSGQIIPVASHGKSTHSLQDLHISIRSEDSAQREPSARAYLEDRMLITRDGADTPPSQSPGDALWGCSGSFPLHRHGQAFAVLSVYHEDPDFFDAETTELLDEMVRDVAFALDNFDREQERRSALQALKSNEKRFRAYFERSLFGMAGVRPDGSWLEVNSAFLDLFGYSEEELASLSWPDLTHPDDREASRKLVQQLFNGTINDFVIEKRYIRKSGQIFDALLAVRAVRNDDGSVAYGAALVEDITPRKMAERREQMRRQALEMVAKARPLDDTMHLVIAATENICPGSRCSILLLDDEGTHLISGAAPSLPDFYNQAINGVRIGPGVGSCGTAAFTGKRVIVEDIATHPYWEKYKGLAIDAGLASSWSEPIISASGKVLGTFAIYRHTPSTPDSQEIALIENAASLVSIAIERVRAEEELHLAASIYSNSSEAVLVTDADNNIVAINPAFTQITGYTLEEVRGKTPSILHSGRHDRNFFRAMWQALERDGLWQGEIWNRRKNGETFPEWLSINAIHNDAGEVQRYVAIGSDITNKVRSDELIWHQANYDFLTDLPNRYMFQNRLEQEIRQAQRDGSLLALLFIDLDRFKDVNDTLGHPVGDQLLIDTAARISRCVRESDTVARMGGDEFTVILRELEQTSDAEKVAEQIISELSTPFLINNDTIYTSASIGITFCPDDGSEVDQLISNADQAMYASKAAGRNCISYFTRALQDSAQKRLTLINDMRLASEFGQFELHFQPIIDLACGLTIKAEALIRWNHPTRGLISPAEFIPLAEETGLILRIGEWVFKEAVAKAKRWQTLTNREVQVSINMSPVQFESECLEMGDWLQHLANGDLETRYLSIEITEGLLLNASTTVIDRLLQCRDAGIQVAIDDFGVGYSALSYLRRFDIDYLKIDQSFIRNLENEQNDRVLCEAIVAMAHKLGLKVTAEGVETEAQRDLLLDMGCDNGQGYLFSRPLPEAQFEEYLLAEAQRSS